MAIKAITLHQPWAQLVALGVKRIETRSWSTSYRGRIAIHAGKRQPKLWEWQIGDWWIDEGYLHQAGRERADGTMDYSAVADRGHYWLRYGAVVATADLVDCVPILDDEDVHPHPSLIRNYPHDGDAHPAQQGGLWLIGWNPLTRGVPTRIEDQRPYGDFSPGRYAWLLDNIKPLAEPVPAKGKQGLWNWEPTNKGAANADSQT